MGTIRSIAPVKLFVGVLTSLPEVLPAVEENLTLRFGPIDERSPEFPFDLTDYYDEEMGTPILRCFFAFERLIAPGEIAPIKALANEIEGGLTKSQTHVRRAVNLDPGYLEESKIVLASTKNFYHRIFLAEGIYGEVTLHYSAGAWHPFPWSFPDFRSGRYHEFFLRVRQTYRRQLKVGADPK